MEIKDMRAFYAIVEEGNISHAAAIGYSSASAFQADEAFGNVIGGTAF